MHRTLRFLLAIFVLGAFVPSAWADPAGEALADRIAAASGSARWTSLERLRFTWRHVPKNVARAYDWNRPEALVTVRIGDRETTLPTNTPEGWEPSPRDGEAHRAFINDSYWLLFPLYLRWDPPARLRDLGSLAVPGMPNLGTLRALEASYGPEGGYTPGDRYVLFVGEDFVPRAWAYHKAGAAEPTLVTTREAYATVGGLTLPTAFRDARGALFVEITGLEAR